MGVKDKRGHHKDNMKHHYERVETNFNAFMDTDHPYVKNYSTVVAFVIMAKGGYSSYVSPGDLIFNLLLTGVLCFLVFIGYQLINIIYWGIYKTR